VDLQNDFTTGYNHYPNNHQQTLHLLDKYSKTVIPRVTLSEGASFAQKGGRGGGRGNNGNGKYHDFSTYDKKYWKDNECYKCHKMRHPATRFPKKSNSNDDDNSSATATVNSVKKLQKVIKSMKKEFTTVNTHLEKLKEAELHTEVFSTTDILFVNKIPFFLTLSRKICFPEVNHLADRMVPQIFKAFK
jgi:hypothetical protein